MVCNKYRLLRIAEYTTGSLTGAGWILYIRAVFNLNMEHPVFRAGVWYI